MKKPDDKDAEQIGGAAEAAKTATSGGNLDGFIHDVLFGNWRTDNLDEPKTSNPDDENTRTK